MKQGDHRALAHYLLRGAGTSGIWAHGRNRRAFVLGCVCPDYLPTTYLRGFGRSHAMRGHHAIYSAAHVKRILRRLESEGIRTVRDCYALGSLIHYLADSFTHVHNESFKGDMREHRLYEAYLHRHFTRYLRRIELCEPSKFSPGQPPQEHWYRVRRSYENSEEGLERDCRAIVDACRSVFFTLCGI